MAPLFADENVPLPLTNALRALAHDVQTAFEAGLANQGIPDSQMLAKAIGLARAVVTNNRRHFHHLHTTTANHLGIVTFTDDRDIPALAARIHAAIVAAEPLAGKLIKIVRPP
jgi:Domain of unknown function (DUF5615)